MRLKLSDFFRVSTSPFKENILIKFPYLGSAKKQTTADERTREWVMIKFSGKSASVS